MLAAVSRLDFEVACHTALLWQQLINTPAALISP